MTTGTVIPSTGVSIGIEDVVPNARFRETHRRVLQCPIDDVWPAVLSVTAHEIRSLMPLLAIRELPARMLRRDGADAARPAQSLLDTFERGGFVMLRKDRAPIAGRAQVLLGAAGRFWSPTNNEPIAFASAAELLEFDEPDHAVTACRLDAIDNGDGTTTLETETVVDGTERGASNKFAPYWMLIRGPSGLIRRDWLAAIDRRARGDQSSSLRPRKVEGLPPGQRELPRFPRFADHPLRPPPPAGEPTVAVAVDGEIVAEIAGQEWERYERVERVSDFHCVTTWSARNLRWGGVRLADVVNELVGSSPPAYAVADGADGTRAIFHTEDIMGDDVLLATDLDGAELDLRHGAPLRLVSPGQYGYKSIKHLVSLDFRTKKPASRYGLKEHVRGRVALEERHAKLPNWAVRVPYRLIIAPTVLLAERSLRKAEPG